jgi:hypothetical protein
MPEGSDLSPVFEERERERERVNGEEGVIGGGGVAGEELSVIVRERGEERRHEKGRRKKKEKEKEKRRSCRGRLSCNSQATPKVPRVVAEPPLGTEPSIFYFLFFVFLVFFFFSFL